MYEVQIVVGHEEEDAQGIQLSFVFLKCFLCIVQNVVNKINFHFQIPHFKSCLGLKGKNLGDFSVIPSEIYSVHMSMVQHNSL